MRSCERRYVGRGQSLLTSAPMGGRIERELAGCRQGQKEAKNHDERDRARVAKTATYMLPLAASGVLECLENPENIGRSERI